MVFSGSKLVLLRRVLFAGVLAILLRCAGAIPAFGQGDSAASRNTEISVFGGPAGVYTGLAGGHNISLTAGLDVGFRAFYGLNPVVEVHGIYPMASGSVDKQENILGGLRLERRHRALRLYGDVLFGRGQIDYLDGGYLSPTGDFRYQTSTGNVLSPGFGVSAPVFRNFSLFADVQFQRYQTPVTTSGTLWSKPVTVGVVYRLPFLKHGHPY